MKLLILPVLIASFILSETSFAATSRRRPTQKMRTSSIKTNSSNSDRTDSLKKEFNTLGDNQVFVERVQNMDNDRKVRIVQNRLVDMNNRVEIGGNFAFIGGGDSYIDSTNYGALLDYHINSKFSFGLRYQKFSNSLTPEAKSMMQRAADAQAIDPASTVPFPRIDSPQDAGIVTFSYYPIYGKLNLFDMGVAHFDVYTIAGYGKMRLKDTLGNQSTTDVLTAGGGLAAWLSQHFAMRFEARYVTYNDLITTENRRENTVQGMLSIGVLL